ncbi:hypothetical protein M3Y97_00900900 [Aphelenchoides bicaudatus]|nr:hypothetical protein M3Y97_00900900 [Aphelenchoides bicaudatus]
MKSVLEDLIARCLCLCLLIEPYTVFVLDSSQSFIWVVYAAYFLKIQGFVSIVFVLIWNFKRKRQNFQSVLVEASSGAGCLRKDKQLRTVNYTFLLYNLLRLLFVIGVAFLRKFYRPPNEFENEQQEESNEQFFVITVFTSVVCGIGQLIAFSIILSFTCIMSSEFRALADDFRSDPNTYQLAVVTHYTFAYKNLLRLYSCLKEFLEFWINAQLCFAYFQIFYILSTVDLFDGSVELSLNFILLVDALITITTNCYLTIRVDNSLKGLCVSMLSLSISGKVLNEGNICST